MFASYANILSGKDAHNGPANIGLTIGSYTRVAVNPIVAHKLKPKLSVGIKLSYEYIRDNRYNTRYDASNYGAGIFARYRLLPPLYFHVEYAEMNYQLYAIDGSYNRRWVPFLLVGEGYSQRMGPRTWLNMQVLFDVLQNEYSPYDRWNPIFSVGITAGF